MTPRIVYSPLTKQWFIATKYREKNGIDASTGACKRYLVASVKHDVTDQMEKILRATADQLRPRKRR